MLSNLFMNLKNRAIRFHQWMVFVFRLVKFLKKIFKISKFKVKI